MMSFTVAESGKKKTMQKSDAKKVNAEMIRLNIFIIPKFNRLINTLTLGKGLLGEL
jgi:hypothetical protein